jgi:hypothetical protein
MKEQFIYGVEIDKTDNIDEMTEAEVIEAGERSGVVYSLKGFISELNSDQLDTENYWFRII